MLALDNTLGLIDTCRTNVVNTTSITYFSEDFDQNYVVQYENLF